MKYILYGNGGSGNHGCEAIVRGTNALLAGELRIHSIAVSEDKKYGLEEFAEVVPACTKTRRNFQFLYAYIKMKLTGNYVDLDGIAYFPTIQEAKGKADIVFSVGGDNYCYEGTEIYRYLNRVYKKNNFKTVLWGCSVEPNIVVQPETSKDLCRYNLIVARESITYEAIKNIGANVILAPDPAFFMGEKLCEVEDKLLSNNVVGINISPHILKCAENYNIAYENYLRLVQYILQETDFTIALIPHVVWESNDDRKVLRKLYEDVGQNERVILVDDHTAPELKYIISHCRMFVGARTHATIAAYSSCVPTLVVGYSVKARGIARDLFGTEDGYVIPVQSLSKTDDLLNAFICMSDREEQDRAHLETIMPEYKKKGEIAVAAIEQLAAL